MGSMIRTYREVEERLAEAAGAPAGQRLQTWRLPALYLQRAEMELGAIFSTAPQEGEAEQLEALVGAWGRR